MGGDELHPRLVEINDRPLRITIVNGFILDTRVVSSGNNDTVLNAECRIVKIECIYCPSINL